jgi:membrane protein YqaA with SNARE-associated domain
MVWSETLMQLFLQYGLIGLGLQSFLSSLIFFPGYAELLIPVYIGLKLSPYQILLVVSVGSILGGVVNYYLGFLGARVILKKKKEIKKAKVWLDKWGDLSVFVTSFLPGIPFDIVAVLVGFLKMDFKSFFISMSLGKIIKYVLIIFGIEVFSNILPMIL